MTNEKMELALEIATEYLRLEKLENDAEVSGDLEHAENLNKRKWKTKRIADEEGVTKEFYKATAQLRG